MTEAVREKKSREQETCPGEVSHESPVPRNYLIKKQMAEQLMAMGLSQESVTRILHLQL